LTIIIFLNSLDGLVVHEKVVNPKEIFDDIKFGLKIKKCVYFYIILSIPFFQIWVGSVKIILGGGEAKTPWLTL